MTQRPIDTTFKDAIGDALPIVGQLGAAAIAIPFYTSVLRWRVDYVPRTYDLAHTRENYVSVQKRVYAKEGFSGLYRGATFAVLNSAWPVGFGYAWAMASMLAHRLRPSWGAYLLNTGSVRIWASFQLASLACKVPFDVLLVRSIVSPRPLSFLSPIDNLKRLLTPTERANPLRLFTAGRFAATLIPAIGSFLLSFGIGPHLDSYGVNGLYAYYAAQLALALLVKNPCSVIAAKLNAQKDIAVDDVDDIAEDGKLVSGVSVRARPYAGFLDAYQTITEEEGAGTLFRGYWIEAATVITRIYLGIPF